eukprot:COSAG06_NODE_186_length_20792_cov_1041.487443_22_plen_304_part_00
MSRACRGNTHTPNTKHRSYLLKHKPRRFFLSQDDDDDEQRSYQQALLCPDLNADTIGGDAAQVFERLRLFKKRQQYGVQALTEEERTFAELSEQVPVATESSDRCITPLPLEVPSPSGSYSHKKLAEKWSDRDEIAIKLSGTMGPWDIEDLCKEPYQEFGVRGEPKTLKGAEKAAKDAGLITGPKEYNKEYKEGTKHPPLGLHCRPADVDGERWFYISTGEGEKKGLLQPQPEPEPEPELGPHSTTYTCPPQPEPEPELEPASTTMVQRSSATSRYAPLQREHPFSDTVPAAVGGAAMRAHGT